MQERGSPYHHEEEGHSCNHRHGIQKLVEKKIYSKSKPSKAKMGLATVLRIASLIVCPGDDIAAATLAAIHQDHQEIQAIMPAPLRIETEIVILSGNKQKKIQY